MQWALSSDSNGAYNLRLPGLAKYTRDVVGDRMGKYISDDMSLEEMSQEVATEWRSITSHEGTLDQLEVYRAALGLDHHSDFELCKLHRGLMDERDASMCRQFDPKSTKSVILASVVPSILVVLAVLWIFLVERRREHQVGYKVEKSELEFRDTLVGEVSLISKVACILP